MRLDEALVRTFIDFSHTEVNEGCNNVLWLIRKFLNALLDDRPPWDGQYMLNAVKTHFFHLELIKKEGILISANPPELYGQHIRIMGYLTICRKIYPLTG